MTPDMTVARDGADDGRGNHAQRQSNLTVTGKLTGTPAEMDRQLIVAQEVFAGRLVPTDEAAMARAIRAVNVAHESKIDATWRELLTVAFRAAGQVEDEDVWR